MTVELLSVSADQRANPVHYRQALSPSHKEGTFVADDTDNHDFYIDARGKRNIRVAINNPSNQTLTWSLYGLHDKDAAYDAVGSFEVDVTNTINTLTKGGALNTVEYPYYLLRCSFAVAPDSTTVRVFVNAMGS